MIPATTDDVLELLDGALNAATLGAAMERGLFWRLDEQPLDAAGVAQALGIPVNRCRYWLRLLLDTGLIQRDGDRYAPSPLARASILDALSEDTWAFLARESRERLPALRELPAHLGEPGSVWEALGIMPPMYFDKLASSPERARRFTRMLFELHGALAEELARTLDLGGVKRMLDLGGGSGVISMALARRHPALTVVIVDIPNVCVAGREIVAEQGLEDRISFHAADFLQDELPGGFDLVIECDVNVYHEALFAKVKRALNPGGRFVIIDQLAPGDGVAPAARAHWAFQASLINPDHSYTTTATVRGLLARAGFQRVATRTLPPVADSGERFTKEMVLIEARAD